MADPISLGLGIGTLVGFGGSQFLSNKTQAQPAAAPSPDAPLPPDPSTPASTPGQKPGGKSQQQSFLSGAASLQDAGRAGSGSSSSGGKTLLGQ